MVENPHGIHTARPGAAFGKHSVDGGGELENTRPEWNDYLLGPGVVADAMRE